MTAAPKPFSWDFAPGIVKADSSLAADRRYVDAQWVRFVRNKPEKIGGFAKRSTFQFSGIPRSILEWADLLGRTLVAVGSSGALEVLSQDGTPINITPASRTVALANPFSTLAHSWSTWRPMTAW